MAMRTAMIYLEIECEVPFREVVDKNCGADADGRRGVPMTFHEQDGEVIIHTENLPEAVAQWARAEAIRQWEEQR